MPLSPGSSRNVVSSNISELMGTGKYPQKQAIAIALSNARRHPRAEGGGIDTRYSPPIDPREYRRPPLAGGDDADRRDEGEPGPLSLEGSIVGNTTGRRPDEMAVRGVYRKTIPFKHGGGLGELPGYRMGGPVAGLGSLTAVEKALRAANSLTRQKLESGGMPEVPYFERQEARQLSQGSHPSGLIASSVPGRTDMHNADVLSGSYILPADVISGLGEGNTMAGARITDEMLSTGPWGTKLPPGRRGSGVGIPHPPAAFQETGPMASELSHFTGSKRGGKAGKASGETVPIVVAGGEYIVPPDRVAAIGGGDIHRGHRILDAFVLHVRHKTTKTLKNLPGPVK